MKINSLHYLTKEGFKNIWDNRLMSLASVGVLVSCMIMIGAAMLITFNVDKAMSAIEQENVVMAYLNDYNDVKYSDKYIDSSATTAKKGGTSSGIKNETAHSDVPASQYLVHNDAEAMAVCDEIRKIDNVVNVEYISADAGIERLVQRIDADQAKYIRQLQENGENPLSCCAKIKLDDLSKFDETIAKIGKVPAVSSITSQRDLAQKVTSIKNAITLASYIIILILLIIALVIVCNTIRVTMFNRKLEISIMKAVGATDSFIRFPFVVEGIVIGLISAVITLGLLYVGYSGVLTLITKSLSISPIPYKSVILLFAGVFALVGILSGLIGSAFMINKYLKKEGSEFSAMS